MCVSAMRVNHSRLRFMICTCADLYTKFFSDSTSRHTDMLTMTSSPMGRSAVASLPSPLSRQTNPGELFGERIDAIEVVDEILELGAVERRLEVGDVELGELVVGHGQDAPGSVQCDMRSYMKMNA